jgi:hypothetical protein
MSRQAFPIPMCSGVNDTLKALLKSLWNDEDSPDGPLLPPFADDFYFFDRRTPRIASDLQLSASGGCIIVVAMSGRLYRHRAGHITKLCFQLRRKQKKFFASQLTRWNRSTNGWKTGEQ